MRRKYALRAEAPAARDSNYGYRRFWVAQRFTAAINRAKTSALAAEVRAADRTWLLYFGNGSPARNTHALGCCVNPTRG
jgi:hypothetical protein